MVHTSFESKVGFSQTSLLICSKVLLRKDILFFISELFFCERPSRQILWLSLSKPACRSHHLMSLRQAQRPCQVQQRSITKRGESAQKERRSRYQARWLSLPKPARRSHHRMSLRQAQRPCQVQQRSITKRGEFAQKERRSRYQARWLSLSKPACRSQPAKAPILALRRIVFLLFDKSTDKYSRFIFDLDEVNTRIKITNIYFLS